MKGFRVRIFGCEVLALDVDLRPQLEPAPAPEEPCPDTPKKVSAGQTLGTVERAWSPTHREFGFVTQGDGSL